MERPGHLYDISERRALGIQVEDEPVRPVEGAEARAPEMERNGPQVNDVAERVDVVHDEVVDLALGVLGVDPFRADPRRNEIRRVLLEERLPRDPVGVTGQDQRAILEVREEERRHRLVVCDQVAFCVPLGWPEDFSQVRESHPPFEPRRLGRDSLIVSKGQVLLLSPALLGELTADSEKCRMAKSAVFCPLGEAHLADELRLDPVMAAAGRTSHLKGGRLAAEGKKRLPNPLEPRLIKSGPDLGEVDEARPLEESHVERPEVAA